MKLAVDVMGFENNLEEAIKACRKFVSDYSDVEIILIGNKIEISNLLISGDNFDIVHSNDVILQTDTIRAINSKKDSSMFNAIKLVKEKKADGVLSAGASAIYVFLTYREFGLIDHIAKPGFMPYVPTFDKKGFNILDVGASINCTGIDLYNFALMGNIYLKANGIKNPRIGLLNIGTETHKGLEFHREADKLLKQNKKLNYIGNIEPKNLLKGEVDLLVTDGYAGNIYLKTIEGTSKSIIYHLLSNIKKPLLTVSTLFSIPLFLKFKKIFDYKNNAGAFVLGLNHICVKTHGSADYKQFYSSLRMLRDSIKNNVLEKIKKEIKNEFKSMKR